MSGSLPLGSYRIDWMYSRVDAKTGFHVCSGAVGCNLRFKFMEESVDEYSIQVCWISISSEYGVMIPVMAYKALTRAFSRGCFLW